MVTAISTNVSWLRGACRHSLNIPPHAVSNVVFLSILVVLSGAAILIQSFFQISLATSYKDVLSPPCEFSLFTLNPMLLDKRVGTMLLMCDCVLASTGNDADSIWRQVGFVL